MNAALLADLNKNRYLQTVAFSIGIISGALVIYHMLNYHIPLAKIQLAQAKQKALTGE
jgi:hypothetical protein